MKEPETVWELLVEAGTEMDRLADGKGALFSTARVIELLQPSMREIQREEFTDEEVIHGCRAAIMLYQLMEAAHGGEGSGDLVVQLMQADMDGRKIR